MQLTVTTSSGQVMTVHVEAEEPVEHILAILHVQMEVPMESLSLTWQGRPLNDLNATLASIGIQNEDMVLVTLKTTSVAPNNNIASSRPGMHMSDIPNNASPELLIDIMDKNPTLLAQVGNIYMHKIWI